MPAASSVLLDPFAVVPPVGRADALAELEDYVDRVLHLSQLQRLGVLYMHVGAAGALSSDGLYPVLHGVRELLNSCDEPPTDIATLTTLVTNLLCSARPLADTADLDEMLIDDFEEDPTSVTVGVETDEVLRQTLAIASLQASTGGSSSALIFCTRTEAGRHRVKCAVLAWEPSGAIRVDAPEGAPSCEATLMVATTPRECRVSLCTTSLWVRAEGRRPLLYDVVGIAVAAAAAELSPATTPGTLRFGRSFLEAAKLHGFLHESPKARRLLATIAEIVYDQKMGQTHALRVGMGACDPQRSRTCDGAGAWRRDVDYEYHLHYWRKGRCFELAWIGVHNDFRCPE